MTLNELIKNLSEISRKFDGKDLPLCVNRTQLKVNLDIDKNTDNEDYINLTFSKNV